MPNYKSCYYRICRDIDYHMSYRISKDAYMLLGIALILQIFAVYLSIKISDGFFLAPQVLYTLGFLFSITGCLIFSKQWQFTLDIQTFSILTFGSFFVVGSSALMGSLIKKFFHKRKNLYKQQKHHLSTKNKTDKFNKLSSKIFSTSTTKISKLGLVFLILLQLITIPLVLQAISKLYPSGSLDTSISLYKTASTFSTKKDLYPPVNQLKSFSTATSYFLSLLLAEAFARRELSNKPLLIVAYLLTAITTLLGGSRTAVALDVIIFFVGYALYLYINPDNKTLRRPTIKIVIGFICFLALFLVAYKYLQAGIKSSASMISYAGIYLGGEIPNLNLLLKEGIGNTGIWGYKTFSVTINYLGEHLGISDWVYAAYFPFRYFNGYPTGNVCSIYGPLFYDFGYIGIPIFLGIMCFINELFLHHVSNYISLNITKTMFTFFCANTFFSFFGENFFSNCLSINVIRIFFYITIADILLYLGGLLENLFSIKKINFLQDKYK